MAGSHPLDKSCFRVSEQEIGRKREPEREMVLETDIEGDFPRGPVVKNSPSNARDADLIPGWRTKIPHATGQRSSHAATREGHAL